jgi:hypothetical protein
MGYAGYKAQGLLIERPHTHDRFFDFIKRIDVFQEFPVAIAPIFKDLLDYVAPIFISRKRSSVRIPKQML